MQDCLIWETLPIYGQQQLLRTSSGFLMYIVRDQSVMVKDIEVVMYGDGPTEPMEPMVMVCRDEDAFPNPAASVDADMDGLPTDDGATLERSKIDDLDDDPRRLTVVVQWDHRYLH